MELVGSIAVYLCPEERRFGGVCLESVLWLVMFVSCLNARGDGNVFIQRAMFAGSLVLRCERLSCLERRSEASVELIGFMVSMIVSSPSVDPVRYLNRLSPGRRGCP